ncbi:MAG: DNA cytosine methyltransferase, partial [Planctomycetota bacterium]
MTQRSTIPVIDLFAGPGGLGEGFSAFGNRDPKFRIGLSVEMEEKAHQTLELRAFYRQFLKGKAPKEYYSHLRGEIDRQSLFDAYSEQAKNARNEAMHAELGETDPDVIDARISTALDGVSSWILIGGPPCQAYSLVGRSRNKGNDDYEAEKDHRHFLYREYLRIIADHQPPVFVMENVKGILSSKVNGEPIFNSIRKDLKAPYKAIPQSDTNNCYNYNLYSFVKTGSEDLSEGSLLKAEDYIIQCERFGVPQARHRVIILGVREDFNDISDHILTESDCESVWNVIEDLPRVRSGLSKGDSSEAWKQVIESALESSWLEETDDGIRKCIITAIETIRLPHKKRGAEYIAHE